MGLIPTPEDEIFSFSQSSNETKHGVEFHQSTYNASRIHRKWGLEEVMRRSGIHSGALYKLCLAALFTVTISLPSALKANSEKLSSSAVSTILL